MKHPLAGAFCLLASIAGLALILAAASPDGVRTGSAGQDHALRPMADTPNTAVPESIHELAREIVGHYAETYGAEVGVRADDLILSPAADGAGWTIFIKQTGAPAEHWREFFFTQGTFAQMNAQKHSEAAQERQAARDAWRERHARLQPQIDTLRAAAEALRQSLRGSGANPTAMIQAQELHHLERRIDDLIEQLGTPPPDKP